MEMNPDVVTIVADGGSRGNHQTVEPREAYGSFKVFYQGKEVRHFRYQFGDMTAPEAEWSTLIKVCQYLTDKMELNAKKGKPFPPVVILFDCRQIVETMNGRMKTKAQNLKVHSDECQLWYMGKEEEVKFVRITDQQVKAILGH